MAPTSTIKYLYAAFAENSSCGPSSYYEEAMQCGSASNTATTTASKNTNGSVIEKKRTFDGSLEVGIRKESEVFGHTTAQQQDVQLYSLPHKEDNSRGTPDTSPNSSPESSVDLLLTVDLNNDDTNTAGDVNNCSGPQCPNLNSLEFEKNSNTGASHLAMKKTSFVDMKTLQDSIGQDRSSEDMSFTATAEVIKSKKKQVQEVVEDIKIVKQQEAPPLATTNMFTKEDLDAITPRQINSYLTKKEQKEICTHLLSSNCSYTLAADKNEACNVCNMPKLYSSGELVVICEICPVLKERVLKKILHPGTPITTSSSNVDVTDVNNAGLIDIADLSPFEQDLLVGALSCGSSTAMKSDDSVAHDDGTSSKDNTEISTANDNFIVETKKSVIDGVFNTKQIYDNLKSSFVCNFDELEVPAGGDSVELAREMLGAKVHLLLAEMAKCNQAVEVASEMLSSKVSEYTDSVQQSKVTSGLDFKEVQEARF